MTQACTRPVDQRKGRAANPYLQVLRLPGALSFSATGFVARMPMSMFGLGTVLLIAAVTGKYGLAGAVAAVGSVGYAITAPQLAKLTDRFGQRRVLQPQVTVFALATVALMVLAEARAPLAAVVISGTIAGATMPSMGPMVRARWSELLADGDRLHTAFSLESVIDEFIFVAGPVIVTLLATGVYPPAGLAAAMLFGLVGTLLFTAQRRSEPPVRPRVRPGDGTAGNHRAGAPGLVTLVPVYWLLGAMFAAIELATVAFTKEQGHAQLAGVILGMYALGSAAGGLWYGTRHWHRSLEGRFAVTLAWMAAGVATFAFQPGLGTLFAVIFLAGLSIAPTLIAGYSLIDRQAPPARRTECMTWLSSAISVGVATGSPLAGHLIDARGAHWGYALAAVCGAGAVLICLAGMGRLRLPAPAAANSDDLAPATE
ncbi:MAG TPA: MFS transporter [Streptosporangiaceae bacterium]